MTTTLIDTSMEGFVQFLDRELDQGHIWALATNGRYWKCRRNGQTRIEKRSGHFIIPVKAGFRSCAHLENDSSFGCSLADWCDFIISKEDPNGKAPNGKA